MQIQKMTKTNNIINVGIDMISKNRIDLNNHPFIKKIFSINEKKIFDLLINDESKISFISSRWAAKEAIYKALNNKDILFINIEILNDENGKPYCSNYNKIILSISHTKVHCIAVALLVK